MCLATCHAIGISGCPSDLGRQEGGPWKSQQAQLQGACVQYQCMEWRNASTVVMSTTCRVERHKHASMQCFMRYTSITGAPRHTQITFGHDVDH